MEPVTQPLDLPGAYGRPDQTLAWPDVRSMVERATHYWISTTRADGRPHVVPKDGIWLDDTLVFGGDTATVNHHNLSRDDRAVAHVGSGDDAVVVEGRASWLVPTDGQVRRLVAASSDKYGYAAPPEAYAAGVWALRPRRVFAWTRFPADATRFVFDDRQ